MIRRFRRLGLAFAATAAISSSMLAAPALGVQFHTSASPTTLSGEGVTAQVFEFPGAGTVKCNSAKFTGTVTGTTVNEIQVSPSYSGCSAFGFATTHLFTTQCGFKSDGLSGSGVFTATVHFLCSGTGKIVFTPTFLGASVCTIEVSSQTPGNVVHVANQDNEDYLLVTSTLNGISHTAGCGTSAASDATYSGSIAIRGGANRIWVT